MDNVLGDVLEIFTGIGTWIVTQVQALTPMFWAAETGLTFLGVLAVAGLSISVILLLLSIIQGFLHFRG